MESSLNFESKPRYKFGAANIILLPALEVPDFIAPLLAVLLRNHDPVVIVLAVLDHKLFEGRGVNSKLCTDIVRPKILDDLDSSGAENSWVEASNEDIALVYLVCDGT